MLIQKDGHIHTPFCPHGTKDALHLYVEKAIEIGLKEITFTEHAPLPKGFTDTTPTKDSSITMETMPDYLHQVQTLKDQYAAQIKINCGLEVDYIEGFEEEITAFLNEWGSMLDDSILSVHFLKNKQTGEYQCLDYSPELFAEMIIAYNGITPLYDCYYQTVSKSIEADLGSYKPKRIGHLSLVHKFQLLYKREKDDKKILESLLLAIQQKGYELDYNAAGLAKPYCKETYPPPALVKKAQLLGIPIIYGSDAHQAKDIGQGFDHILKMIN